MYYALQYYLSVPTPANMCIMLYSIMRARPSKHVYYALQYYLRVPTPTNTRIMLYSII